MDDTHCFSDAPSSANFDLKGLKTVKVRTTGNKKLWFNFMFTAGICKVDK